MLLLLPPELQYVVVQQLATKSLLALTLACRHLRRLSHPFLYRRLVVTPLNMHQISSRLFCEQNACATTLPIANCVETLCIESPFGYPGEDGREYCVDEEVLYLFGKAICCFRKVKHLQWSEGTIPGDGYEIPLPACAAAFCQHVRETFFKLQSLELYFELTDTLKDLQLVYLLDQSRLPVRRRSCV
jgi:hypothetical protein